MSEARQHRDLLEDAVSEPSAGAHAFNLGTREAEAGRSLGVRDQPGLQELVPGQPHSETRSHRYLVEHYYLLLPFCSVWLYLFIFICLFV